MGREKQMVTRRDRRTTMKAGLQGVSISVGFSWTGTQPEMSSINVVNVELGCRRSTNS